MSTMYEFYLLVSLKWCTAQEEMDGQKMTYLLQKLILRHNIQTEETEGLKSCVITLHSLLHLPEDIERFSSPDNY